VEVSPIQRSRVRAAIPKAATMARPVSTKIGVEFFMS